MVFEVIYSVGKSAQCPMIVEGCIGYWDAAVEGDLDFILNVCETNMRCGLTGMCRVEEC